MFMYHMHDEENYQYYESGLSIKANSKIRHFVALYYIYNIIASCLDRAFKKLSLMCKNSISVLAWVNG